MERLMAASSQRLRHGGNCSRLAFSLRAFSALNISTTTNTCSHIVPRMTHRPVAAWYKRCPQGSQSHALWRWCMPFYKIFQLGSIYIRPLQSLQPSCSFVEVPS